MFLKKATKPLLEGTQDIHHIKNYANNTQINSKYVSILKRANMPWKTFEKFNNTIFA